MGKSWEQAQEEVLFGNIVYWSKRNVISLFLLLFLELGRILFLFFCGRELGQAV